MKILIVDDHEVVRNGIRSYLETVTQFQVVGEAASGEEALLLAADLRPELILLDIRMPVMDGIETARRLSTEHPGGVIVLISIDDPPESPDELGSCGARALIRKQDFGSLALRRLWDAHGDPDFRTSHHAPP